MALSMEYFRFIIMSVRSWCLKEICSFLLVDTKLGYSIFIDVRKAMVDTVLRYAVDCGRFHRRNGAMTMYACILHHGIANRLCASSFHFHSSARIRYAELAGCMHVCVVKICKFLAVNSPRPAVEFTHMCFAHSHTYTHAADMRHIE